MFRTARRASRVLAAAACWRSPARRHSRSKPFTADYQANYMGMQGNGQMTLAAAGGDRWTLQLNISSSLAS